MEADMALIFLYKTPQYEIFRQSLQTLCSYYIETGWWSDFKEFLNWKLQTFR
jgi:hypothetical protein